VVDVALGGSYGACSEWMAEVGGEMISQGYCCIMATARLIIEFSCIGKYVEEPVTKGLLFSFSEHAFL
jgi:hypothetical protein